MNPSILPPFTSRTESSCSCGPPFWSKLRLTYGRTHFPPWNLSGTHTRNEPSARRGMPFAPGYVPK